MSLQMLKMKIKSLGENPTGDTADSLRKQLAQIEQGEPEPELTEEELAVPETEAEAVAALSEAGIEPESEKDTVDLPADEQEKLNVEKTD